MITAKELVSLLNGREYGSEITREESLLAKASGLVVVYGASDDLMEFEGAISDELEAWEGTTARLSKDGILDAPCKEERNFCINKCKYFKDVFGKAKTIEAIWGKDGMSWQYKTDIPHETFDILEDGDVYCRGIVFSMNDV